MPFPPILEVVIFGVPVSLQARGPAKAVWRATVAARARAAWAGAPLLGGEVTLSIGSYHDNPWLPDVDNIIKPIQDALETVIYANDRQVSDTLSYKRDLTGPIAFVYSPRLRLALATGREFVHIQASPSGLPHYDTL